jgi:hypothetical protein
MKNVDKNLTDSLGSGTAPITPINGHSGNVAAGEQPTTPSQPSKNTQPVTPAPEPSRPVMLPRPIQLSIVPKTILPARMYQDEQGDDTDWDGERDPEEEAEEETEESAEEEDEDEVEEERRRKEEDDDERRKEKKEEEDLDEDIPPYPGPWP